MKKSIVPTTTTKPTSKTKQASLYTAEVAGKMKQYEVEGNREPLVNEVRKAYQIAKRYQLAKHVAKFAAFLQYYYYHEKGEKRRGDIFNEEMLRYNEIAFFENIVDGKFARMSFQLNKTRNPSAQLRQELADLCTEFQTYLKYDSIMIRVFTYMLLNAKAHLDQDFEKLISQSTEVINYLEEKEIERTSHFYKDLTVALIAIKDYAGAKEAINKALVGRKVDSLIWSIYTYYRFIIDVHNEDYQSAYEVFKKAEKSRQINKAMYEQWLIVRGYVQFLIRMGKIEGTAQFKLGKFINDTPVFSKDKEGNNINILILKILLRLQKDHNGIIDDKEAIRQYAFRHLKGMKRSATFIKMLLQIADGNFNAIAVKRRTKDVVLADADYLNPDIEVVPYERLWGMVLEGLG